MAKASASLLKRRLDIAEIVRKKREVKVDELCELLSVSGVTIRQDLNYLEEQGYLKRSFGGAIYLSPESATSTKSSDNSQLFNQENSDIELVQQTLSFIQDGDCLFLGHGSLIRKLIPYLFTFKNLTLLVNDLNHVSLIKTFLPQSDVIVLGGSVDEIGVANDPACLGYLLKRYPVNLSIVEISFISSDNQLMISEHHLGKFYQDLFMRSSRNLVMLPQRMVQDENSAVGLLQDVNLAILSRSAMTEYHQQFLDNQFIQWAAHKKSIIYQRT
ncbi:DeoR/GlpR family DNA-binding transcription regulator [Utexia brackfieldae]|uniref:DeoR/GlpR family DNA-binding transcription regulator n=1 Tax=Utexia brackfieldae TaxID=3074108 RepID=UPI00370D82FA